MATKNKRWHQPILFGVKVPGDGPTPAELMLIGERPGRNEPRSGRPFTGAAGMELDRYLTVAGLSRSSVYVTNLVKDYLDEDPTPEEVQRDLPELQEELLRVSPGVVIPLGRFAIRHFLGDVDVEQVHGLLHRGVAPYSDRMVFPIFHPAAGLHNGDTVQFIHRDFEQLRALLLYREEEFNSGPNLMEPPDCLLPRDDLRRVYLPASPWEPPLWPATKLALDTEWVKTSNQPWCLTWSQDPGSATLVRAGETQYFATAFAKFQAAGGIVLLHNSLADLNPLARMGIHVADDQFIDTMVLVYLLCRDPQGLKALAYRRAGMTMRSYDEVIGPARLPLQLAWLEEAELLAPHLAPPELELRWDDKTAGWKVKKPQGPAQKLKRLRGDLEKGETAVDIAARVGKWDDTASGELLETIGEVPEPSLDDVDLGEATDYACCDADATGRVAPGLLAEIEEQGLGLVMRIDHGVIPMANSMQTTGMLIDRGHFECLRDEMKGEMSGIRDRIEAMVGVRINPGSPDQVRELLFKQLGLPASKWTSGGKSGDSLESTQDKVLESLRSAHPVLPLIMDYRERDKIRSFCVLLDRTADKDGRIRGQIRVTRVASGRFSMTKPNLMAIPVRSDLGKRVRDGFPAPEGKVLGTWDLDQVEMRWMAEESQCQRMIEVFNDPKRDVHSENAAGMFSLPLPHHADGSIDYSAVDKLKHRYPAKRVGFGVITGITGLGLKDQMDLAGAMSPDGDPWTSDECDEFIAMFFGANPEVRRYMDRCRAKCRRQGWVADYWGRRRWLPQVWSTVERIREEALRASHSHEIQAGAQGWMKLGMARIWWFCRNVWWPRGGAWLEVLPLLQVHDELLFETPDDEDIKQEVDAVVVDSLCTAGLEHRPSMKIPMRAKGGYGLTWGSLEK